MSGQIHMCNQKSHGLLIKPVTVQYIPNNITPKYTKHCSTFNKNIIFDIKTLLLNLTVIYPSIRVQYLPPTVAGGVSSIQVQLVDRVQSPAEGQHQYSQRRHSDHAARAGKLTLYTCIHILFMVQKL